MYLLVSISHGVVCNAIPNGKMLRVYKKVLSSTKSNVVNNSTFQYTKEETVKNAVQSIVHVAATHNFPRNSAR